MHADCCSARSGRVGLTALSLAALFVLAPSAAVGQTGWQPQPLPALESGVTYQLADVKAVSATQAWAAGGLSDGEALILKTLDGGTWALMFRQGSSSSDPWQRFWNFTRVSVIDSNTAWAAGTYGLTASTTNGGTTWAHEGTPCSSNPGGPPIHVYGLKAVTSTNVWAVGWDEYLGRADLAPPLLRGLQHLGLLPVPARSILRVCDRTCRRCRRRAERLGCRLPGDPAHDHRRERLGGRGSVGRRAPQRCRRGQPERRLGGRCRGADHEDLQRRHDLDRAGVRCHGEPPQDRGGRCRYRLGGRRQRHDPENDRWRDDVAAADLRRDRCQSRGGSLRRRRLRRQHGVGGQQRCGRAPRD